MANADRPKGAAPVRNLNGGTAIQTNDYTVDSSNGTAIYLGDFLVIEADGNVIPYAVTTGGNLLGVCVGVVGDYGDLTRRYLPASTAGTVMVADDPNTIFAIQEDDAGTALSSTARGANCDVLYTAGSTTTGMSGSEIDRSQVTSAIGQLRLMRLVPREDNAYGDSAEWEVLINEHHYNTVDAAGI